RTWDQLLASLAQLSLADRVNLLGDTWALVQANRAPLAMYITLVSKLPRSTDLAQWDQVILALDYVNRLLVGQAGRDKFQQYARSVLRPVFDQVGSEAKGGEP